MNYTAHYERLIARSRGRELSGYVERHHVVPRCMGGGDDGSNIVELTAEEHYVVHQLLVRIYPNNRRLAHAAVWMAKRCSGNKAYGWLRRRHVKANAEAQRGKKMSPEACANMSTAHRGKPLSKEHAANAAKARLGQKSPMLGKKHSPESKAKTSAAMFGKQKTKVARAHMREAAKKRGISAEVRAKMLFAQKSRTPEQLSAIVRKAWCTRRANATLEGTP